MGPLTMAIDFTKGPILEIGMGSFSTSLIACAKGDREAVGLEEQEDFYVEMVRQYQDLTTYKIRHVANWEVVVPVIKKHHYGVILIDNETAPKPSFETRRMLIRELKDTGDIILVHDTQHPRLADPEIWAPYKYVWIYKPLDEEVCPWTTMASVNYNFLEVMGLKSI
jgi:hypothetical protein